MPKLADVRIKTVNPGSRDRWVGDGMGLWLRVRTSGTKTLVIRSKTAGKTRVVTLGEWPHYTLARARTAVQERRNKVSATTDAFVAISVRELAEEFYDRMILHDLRVGSLRSSKRRTRTVPRHPQSQHL